MICKLCNRQLSRGTAKQYSFETSSMWKHMRAMHPRNYARLCREMEKAKTLTTTSQSSSSVVQTPATSPLNVPSSSATKPLVKAGVFKVADKTWSYILTDPHNHLPLTHRPIQNCYTYTHTHTTTYTHIHRPIQLSHILTDPHNHLHPHTDPHNHLHTDT